LEHRHALRCDELRTAQTALNGREYGTSVEQFAGVRPQRCGDAWRGVDRAAKCSNQSICDALAPPTAGQLPGSEREDGTCLRVDARGELAIERGALPGCDQVKMQTSNPRATAK
jgi:hypothetical protein